jgi:hypothetical protein
MYESGEENEERNRGCKYEINDRSLNINGLSY